MAQRTDNILTELYHHNIQKCYDETLTLLIRARDYLMDYEAVNKEGISQSLCMLHSVESFRVTARLTQVMGTLMAHRSYINGEIDKAEFEAQYHYLEAEKICTFQNDDIIQLLPTQLQVMLGRSLSLYMRIARFEDMFQEACNQKSSELVHNVSNISEIASRSLECQKQFHIV